MRETMIPLPLLINVCIGYTDIIYVLEKFEFLLKSPYYFNLYIENNYNKTRIKMC